MSAGERRTTTTEAELIMIVMERFETLDLTLQSQASRIGELEESGERYRAGLQMLARHMRVACDAVAAAAQVAEDLSRESSSADAGTG